MSVIAYGWRLLAGQRHTYILGVLCAATAAAMSLQIPWFLKRAIDSLGHTTGVPQLAVQLILTAFAAGSLQIAARTLLLRAAQRAIAAGREELFRATLREGPLDLLSTGDLLSRMTDDFVVLREAIGQGVLVLVEGIVLLALGAVFTYELSPMLTMYIFSIYPLLIVSAHLVGKRIGRLSGTVNESRSILCTTVEEHFFGIEVLRLQTAEAEANALFAAQCAQHRHKKIAYEIGREFLTPIWALAGSLGIAICLIVGGALVRDPASGFGIGHLVAFIGYLALLTHPVMFLGNVLSLFHQAKAAWERVAVPSPSPRQAWDRPEKGPFRGSLLVRGLTLGDDGGPRLKNICVELQGGEFCVIAGPTGAGKSAFLRALAGFRKLPACVVEVAGQDLARLPPQDRGRLVGYGSQDTFLFSGTIRSNIAFGSPDGTPAEKDLLSAIEDAGLTRDLIGSADEMERAVGAFGSRLSGGQRQQVALARILLSEAPVLLLDDPLTAVDYETEQWVVDALWRRSKKRVQTILLCTQRPYALGRAEHILVFEAGEIVEAGSLRQLLENERLFAQLYGDLVAGLEAMPVRPARGSASQQS